MKASSHPAILRLPLRLPVREVSARTRLSAMRAQHGEVGGGVAVAHAGEVFPEAGVEDPVQAVLDLPVGAHRLGDAPPGRGRARQVVAHLAAHAVRRAGRGVLDQALGLHRHHTVGPARRR